MPDTTYDVIVIGAGPAGYPCAIRAAQNGLKVACVDEWKNRDGTHAYGGTCLNAGCIPSKALLESTELYHRAQSEFAAHGISTGSLAFDVATMQKRKAKIVKASTQGIAALFKAAGVTALQGHGRLLAGQQGRGHRVRRQEGRACRRSTSCSRRARCRWNSRACPSTARTSSTPGARSISTPCRSGSRSSARASSASSSAASGAGSAPRSWCSRRSSSSCSWPTSSSRRKRSSISRSRASTSGSARRSAAWSGARTASRSSTRTPPARSPSPWTRSWSRSAAGPTRGPARRGHGRANSTSAASSRWTTSAAPAPPTSGRWATRCAARCWRTRARRRA